MMDWPILTHSPCMYARLRCAISYMSSSCRLLPQAARLRCGISAGALANITRAALVDVGLGTAPLFGLVTSGFDIRAAVWPGGPAYLAYEREVLSGPGYLASLWGSSVHPYSWTHGCRGRGPTAAIHRFCSRMRRHRCWPRSGANGTVTQLLAVAGETDRCGCCSSTMCT